MEMKKINITKVEEKINRELIIDLICVFYELSANSHELKTD